MVGHLLKPSGRQISIGPERKQAHCALLRYVTLPERTFPDSEKLSTMNSVSAAMTVSEEEGNLEVFKEAKVAAMDLMSSGFTKTFAEKKHTTKNDYKRSTGKVKV